MELYFPMVLDGANGTELQKKGYDGSVCTEKWVLEHPEAMLEVQKAYIEAGSDIIYAPTFGANRVKLEENGLFNKVRDYNIRLVDLSKRAADCKKGVLVAADIATTGKFLAPLGDITFSELYDIYYEQASALEAAGVDMFMIETIMTVPDARAALLAVRAVSSKPVLVSFTCDENGRTLTGTDVKAALVILQGMGVDAFGLNCSVGPAEIMAQIKRLREVAEVPLAVKPNAGLPKTIDGNTVYDCPPEVFSEYTGKFVDAGVCMIGGCCGTDDSHIRAIRQAVDKADFSMPDCQRHDGILCATEKDVFILEPGITADSVISCGTDLEDNIRKANKSDAGVIAVEILEEADLDEFAMAQYAVRKPLCIVCDDTKLLDEALMLYQGRALYAGSLSASELEPLVKKYGLII